MMKSKLFNIRNLCFGGLFLALGLILPQLFHMLGAQNAGEVFLPMHIPVLLAGFVLGPFYGGLIGILSPLLSSLFFGMPILPRLPFMLVELAAYGVAAGFFYSRKTNIYVSLLLAQVCGRLAKMIALGLAFYWMNLDVAGPLSVWSGLVLGLPGLIIQWVIVPPVVIMIQKVVRIGQRY